MNIQPTAKKKQITAEDLLTFSLEELEGLLTHMYGALEKIIHKISSYAQEAIQIEAQLQKVIGLENRFKEVCEELKVAFEAVIIHAIFSEKTGQDWNKLAHILREDMAFMQAVMSTKEITSEWLAQRDSLVTLTTSLLKESTPVLSIQQWATNKPCALLRPLPIGGSGS